MPQPPDRSTAKAAQAAPAQPELAALVEDYGPALRRYFFRKAPAWEVEDLVQTVFLNMHQRASAEPVDSIERYLFRVAAHVLARRHRDGTARLGQRVDEPAEPIEDISPERIVIGRQALARLRVALGQLPPKTREAFILHRYEEMTYAAIAARLQISVSGVEKLIIRALRQLREAIEDQA